MTNGWYKIVDPNVPITQGDIIFDCPLVTWRGDQLPDLEGKDESEILKAATVVTIADVIVLTQACDLKYDKVANVILCPHLCLEEYRRVWEKEMKRNGQNPTSKAWKSHCDDICDGFVWNLVMINNSQTDSHKIDIRLIDFRDVFSVPRTFLESLLRKRNQPRISLLPPYREHLSQAFARFFMRVGLPIEINQTW
jgi:hypothetical protein